MTKVERIVAEVAELSEEERQQVADRILELVPNESEVAAAWMAEAERRFAEHDAGKTKSVPWSEARERIFVRP
jgi:putative addiction module component (TIGR02574 family)